MSCSYSQIKQRRTINLFLLPSQRTEVATTALLHPDFSVSSLSDCKENKGLYATLKLEHIYNVSEELNITKVSVCVCMCVLVA